MVVYVTKEATLYDCCKVNIFTWRVNQPTPESTNCGAARGNAIGAKN